MSTCISPHPVSAAELIFNRPARRAAAHRRASSAHDAPSQPVGAAEPIRPDGSSTGAGAPILRRWSIAELIARGSWRTAL
jgi:hypothetical protein